MRKQFVWKWVTSTQFSGTLWVFFFFKLKTFCCFVRDSKEISLAYFYCLLFFEILLYPTLGGLVTFIHSSLLVFYGFIVPDFLFIAGNISSLVEYFIFSSKSLNLGEFDYLLFIWTFFHIMAMVLRQSEAWSKSFFVGNDWKLKRSLARFTCRTMSTFRYIHLSMIKESSITHVDQMWKIFFSQSLLKKKVYKLNSHSKGPAKQCGQHC